MGGSWGSECRGHSPGGSGRTDPGTGGAPGGCGAPARPAQRREPCASCPTAGHGRTAGRDPTRRGPATRRSPTQPGPLLTACPPPQAQPRSAAPPVPVRGGGEDRGAASPGRRVPRSLPAGPCPAVPRCRRRGPAALAALASSLTFPCLRRPSPAPSDVTAMATNPRPLPPRPPAPRTRMRHRRQGAGPSAPRGQ